MQFDFFPSRALTLYLGKMFIVRILAVLVMLVLVLLMLDLLTATGKILAVPGNGQAEILTYAGLRMPQLIARFLPYSVLLATIITLVGLNQNSEVVAMKAAGMSAHQVLAPLLLTAFVVGTANFVFNERVVTRATFAGAFLGFPPTGQLVEISGMAVHRIAGGRLAEHWAHADMLGFMQRIGAVADQAPPGR